MLTVEAGTPSFSDTAPVPPKSSMAESTVSEDMAATIVRKSRTGQGFAGCEQTFSDRNAEIRIMRIDLRRDAHRLRVIQRMVRIEGKAAFARAAKIPKSVVTDIEKSKRNIGLGVARKIKGRWKLPLDFVADGDLDYLSPKQRKLYEAAIREPFLINKAV